MTEEITDGGCLQRDFDECRCPCHSNPGMVHCRACCHQCPHCGKNIADYHYDGHVRECKEKKEKQRE